jgi:hypothetical protein
MGEALARAQHVGVVPQCEPLMGHLPALRVLGVSVESPHHIYFIKISAPIWQSMRVMSSVLKNGQHTLPSMQGVSAPSGRPSPEPSAFPASVVRL